MLSVPSVLLSVEKSSHIASTKSPSTCHARNAPRTLHSPVTSARQKTNPPKNTIDHATYQPSGARREKKNRIAPGNAKMPRHRWPPPEHNCASCSLVLSLTSTKSCSGTPIYAKSVQPPQRISPIKNRMEYCRCVRSVIGVQKNQTMLGDSKTAMIDLHATIPRDSRMNRGMAVEKTSADKRTNPVSAAIESR